MITTSGTAEVITQHGPCAGEGEGEGGREGEKGRESERARDTKKIKEYAAKVHNATSGQKNG